MWVWLQRRRPACVACSPNCWETTNTCPLDRCCSCVVCPCLQTEIIDETDQFEDNLQTVQATPQVGWVWGVEAGTAAVTR